MDVETLVGVAVVTVFVGFIIWKVKKSKNRTSGTGTSTGGAPRKPGRDTQIP